MPVRFWDKVDVRDKKDCWEWTGGKAHGYGRFRIGDKTYISSRVSYELVVGDIPDGMCVCHTCDNPGCVNPAHLFLATQTENLKDMTGKKRRGAATGEAHGMAKLSDLDILCIVFWVNNDYTKKDVAKVFNVSRRHVNSICAGEYRQVI